MLKKTLLATAAISAILFAVAALLPEVTHSRSGATSPAPTSTGQAVAGLPLQDKRQANADARAGADGVDAGTEGPVRSTGSDARGDKRGHDSHASKRKKDHDGSDD